MGANRAVGLRLRSVIPAVVAGLAILGLISTASAGASEYTPLFANCPTENPEVKKCLHNVVTGGEVTLGRRTVPVTGETVVQGGYSKPVAGVSAFFGAANGQTLMSEPISVLHLGPVSVDATVELAGSPEDIRGSEVGLLTGFAPAIGLPVKIHLESRLLGDHCYIGSDSEPIVWQLTTGTTAPPPPNEPITGAPGQTEILLEGRVLGHSGVRLVDNSWAAPGASGCGLVAHRGINRMVDALFGLPSPAGSNTVILDPASVHLATAAAVRNGL